MVLFPVAYPVDLVVAKEKEQVHQLEQVMQVAIPYPKEIPVV